MKAKHKANYFITFIDDFTRFGVIYLTTHKSKGLSCFQSYLNLIENQLDRKIKVLRTNLGYEYLFDQFKQIFHEKGIQYQLTILRTPQHNGVTKKRNRMLLEMVRSLINKAYHLLR